MPEGQNGRIVSLELHAGHNGAEAKGDADASESRNRQRPNLKTKAAGGNKRRHSQGSTGQDSEPEQSPSFPDETFWPTSVVTHAKRLARAVGPVLVVGNTGTGKTTLCEFIHRWSGRPTEKCQRVPCGTLRTTLLSTLFGHKSGAFTDAKEDRVGVLKCMDGGSIILDDLDCLSLEAQSALLGFLDKGTFCRLGDYGTTQEADVRILATCNRDLDSLLAEGLLREDFYYRMRCWVVRLPPVSGQLNSITQMAHRFLFEFQNEQGTTNVRGFSKECIELLAAIQWKGNLRDLRQAVRNIALICESSDPVIQVEAAAQALFDSSLFSPSSLPIWSGLPEDERTYRTLALTGWNVRLTARILGVSHQTIYNRVNARGWVKPS